MPAPDDYSVVAQALVEAAQRARDDGRVADFDAFSSALVRLQTGELELHRHKGAMT